MSRTGKTLCAVVGLAIAVGVTSALMPPSRGQGDAKQAPTPGSVPSTGATNPSPSDPTGTPARPSEPSAEDAILQKLDEPTDFAFKEVPLKDAIAAISKKHKVTILINRKKIAEANVSPDTPVVRTARGVSLDLGLTGLLHHLGLGYIIRDEAILVTSREEVETYLIPKIYPLADLLPSSNGAAADDWEEAKDTLIGLMERVVSPQTWKEAGGPGTTGSLPGCLIVSQTRETHRQVVTFLAALRRARKAIQPGDPSYTGVIRVLESPAEQRLEESLRRHVSVSLSDVSLTDIAKKLSREYGLPIQMSPKKLEEANVDPNKARSTLVAEDMSLRSVLQWLLREHGVSWIIRDEALLITSREESETYLVTRFYPVADLFPDGGERPLLLRRQPTLPNSFFGGEAWAADEVDWLTDTITSIVAPQNWKDAGGPGVLQWVPRAPILACTTDQAGHAAVERLLTDLRKHVVAAKPKLANGTWAQGPKTLWTYPVAADSPHQAKLADGAAKLIQDMVAPESWKAKDGDVFVRAWPDRLVVRQTAKAHREIQKLLEEVHLLTPPSSEPPAPPPKDE